MNPRRLYRSRDRQLAGVAGGMAEYLDIDPTVMRILWIIVGLASGGLALVAYVILALVIPQAPYAAATGGWAQAPGDWSQGPAGTGAPAGWNAPPAAPAWTPGWDANAYAAPTASRRSGGRGIGAAAIVGVVLIVVGAIALADAVLPGWAAGPILGPAVILALGAALLAASLRRRPEEAVPAAGPGPAAPVFSAPTQATPGAAAAPAGMATVAVAWDTSDTQAVDAPVLDPAPETTPSGSGEEGTLPA